MLSGNPSQEEAAVSAHLVARAAVASGRTGHHGELAQASCGQRTLPVPCRPQTWACELAAFRVGEQVNRPVTQAPGEFSGFMLSSGAVPLCYLHQNPMLSLLCGPSIIFYFQIQ